MAINKKLIHFKSKQKFNEELANGNILETSIVFIQETTEIYTHGQLYDGSTFDPTDIEASIENIINNKADKTEIPTKISQLEDDKGFLIGEETSDALDDVETNVYVKYVVQTLTEQQKEQARNNIGVPSIEYVMQLYQELLDIINNSQPSFATLDKSILDNMKLA